MRDTKIFFATDIHGSDVCLRKFLNAGRFYGVDQILAVDLVDLELGEQKVGGVEAVRVLAEPA
jgi:Icc-related predicted phosphoesterase